MTISAHRKVVTVLFCDVVGSTALGESVDPEALQALLARYFERMSGIVESHGGSVEKFIGDAVMAVFGVPLAHEDDALRACRAAVEMRDALPELGLAGRIGINTGEVLAGTEERLATGDAVNVAARLEQAAQPGEVLVGAETLNLVAAAVEVGARRPLELKGKSEPVAAYGLLAVREVAERSHASRFVGRERELQQLGDAWEITLAERRCELVTIVGDPGVGKSRLVTETLARSGARVVAGRCLSYGEGITYWPVVEVLKQLSAVPSDQAAAASIRSLLRETEESTSAEEIAWAVRKLLEEQAPLVVLFDDIQWGEETLLDLIEGVALLSSGAPILVLCVARPELLERRPSWPVAVRLGPLPEEAVEELIGEQATGELRGRIAAAAGGNPLFVTEMLAMAMETDDVEVPPTLRAVLAARLDQLAPAERRVLECGSIEGEVFHRGGVQALAPEEQHVTPRLAALVRKELIRSDRAVFAGDDGFRFRHLLIRDAAYDALPKAARAEFHERFGGWLELHGDELVELDEILGYHLEQAARYRAELGAPHPELALRAADRLAAAGRRALFRADQRAAAGLLERALSLSRPLRHDLHLELDLTHAFWDDPRRAAEIAEGAAVRAREAADETGEMVCHAIAVFYRGMLSPSSSSSDELETLLLEARRRLDYVEDHVGLFYVWQALGYGVANARGRYDDWATASLQALHHGRLAGRSGVPPDIGVPLTLGSRPADEALEIVDRLFAETRSPYLLLSRAWLLAMLERSGQAREVGELAEARVREMGGTVWAEWALAEVATLAGDHQEASDRLRTICEWLDATEQLAFLETYLPLLARSLCRLGRFDEAEKLAQRTREFEVDGDPTAPRNPHWRQVLALVYAHRGKLADAEQLAREAVAETGRTQSLVYHCLSQWDLAEVLATAGRSVEAAATIEQAIDLCRRKKNLALARQLAQRLAQLRDKPLPV